MLAWWKEYFRTSQTYKSNAAIENPIYFPCTRDLDCDYLNKFLSGNEVGSLEKYTIRDDQFYIYIPVNGKEARFILMFQRTNSYGKLGS